MVKINEIMKTKINKKGFTLAELLVVVAILAILVAVSIPIFTGKLTEAKEATDAANLRAARAVAITTVLEGNAITKDQQYDIKTGKFVASGTIKEGYNKSTNPNGVTAAAGKAVIVVGDVKPLSDNGDASVDVKWAAI